MADGPDSRRAYAFGPFLIDTADRLLLRDGTAIPLKPKVVDTLILLIEGRDALSAKTN